MRFMLSVQSLSSAANTASYYASIAQYYEGAQTTVMRWRGVGAAQLKLGEECDKEIFQALLEGKLASGQQLGRVRGGEVQHRPGFDMTFSAPKSVSIMALLPEGDKRLIECHDKAVEYTLALFEAEFAETRVVRDHNVTFEKTANLTIASLREMTSREHDPQLHTHNIVMNFTVGRDGKIRALASDLTRAQGTYENAWNYRNVFGAVYRNQLAANIEKLGYALDIDANTGRFEMSGVPAELLTHFSKRRAQIETWLADNGVDGAKASQQATLYTRNQKEDTNWVDLQYRWQSEAKQKGFDARALTKNASANLSREPSLWEKITGWFFENTPSTIQSQWEKFYHVFSPALQQLSPPISPIEQALDFALAHLSEREAVFSDQALRRQLLNFAPTKIQGEGLKSMLRAAVAAEKIIPLQTARGEALWTTKGALGTELQIIHALEQSKGASVVLVKKPDVEKGIHEYNQQSPHPLTRGQAEAVQHLLTSTDLIIGVQGFAGTGKTTMLALVKHLAEKEGLSLRGIAPTATAAKKLETETGISSATVARTLNAIRHHPPDKNTVFILDEASMVGSRDMATLELALAKSNTPLRVIGDELQLPAISHGKPFSLMQLYGMATTEMRDILRQKTPWLKNAVAAVIASDVKKALEGSTWIIQSSDKAERLNALSDAYLSRPNVSRQSLLLIVPTHKDRVDIHEAIREGLQARGELVGATRYHHTLHNKSLTEAQMQHPRFYAIGDVVRFNRDYRSLGMFRQQYVTVVGIDKNKNQLRVKTQSGRIQTLSFKKFRPSNGTIEVYQPRTLALQQGERLRFRRNDYEIGVLNGTEIMISRMDSTHVEMRTTEGKSMSLPFNHPALRHIDHAYTHTDFSVQGHDADTVIALKESHAPQSHLKSFNVNLTRGKYSVTFITDDKEKLIDQLVRHSGEKSSAIEAMTFEQLKQYSGETTPLPKVVFETKRDVALHTARARALFSEVETHNASGKTVLRDRAAAELMQMDKAYHTAFRMNAVMKYAKAHAWRLHYIKASKVEQDALLRLRNYQRLGQTLGRRLGCANHAPELAGLTERYQALAYAITQDLANHTNALKLAGFLNADNTPDENGKFARLLSNSAPAEAKALLQQWQHTDDANEKIRLAERLSDNARLTHRSMLQLGLDTKETWRGLNADNQRAKRNAVFATLDDKAKGNFKTVENYLLAKNRAGQAWKEVFKLKGWLPLADVRLNTVALPEALALSDVRDSLGVLLANNPEQFEAGLSFYQIEPSTFQSALDKHDAEKSVQRYKALLPAKKATGILERSALARRFIEEGKKYFGILKEENVPFKTLYTDAGRVARREKFAAMSTEEKKSTRQCERYEQLNRDVGKAWAKFYALKKSASPKAPEAKIKAAAIAEKRDRLAYGLNANLTSFQPHLREGQETQLASHAARFETYLQETENLWQQLTVLHAETSTVLLKSTEMGAATNRLLDWNTVTLDAQQSLKTFNRNSETHLSRLAALNVDEKPARKILNELTEFKKTANDIINKALNPKTQTPLDAIQQQKIQRVEKLVRLTQPIEGTLAETYLRKHRGITGDIPPSCRFHPGLMADNQRWPALVAIGHNDKQELRAAQIIYLNPETANKAPVEVVKKTIGVLSHDTFGVLIHTGKDKNKIAIAEGIETALSIKEAKPEMTIYATLGVNQFGRVPLNKDTKEVLLCADNDGKKAGSNQPLDRAIQTLSHRGVDVKKVMPTKTKTDFNDVLKTDGVKRITELLQQEKWIAKAVTVKTQLEQLNAIVNKLKPFAVPKVNVSQSVKTLPDNLADVASALNEQQQNSSKNLLSSVLNENKKILVDKEVVTQDKISVKAEQYQKIKNAAIKTTGKPVSLQVVTKQAAAQKNLDREYG